MYIVEREKTAVAKGILARYQLKNRNQDCRQRLENISSNGDFSMLKDEQKYGIIIERTEQPCKSFGLYESYIVLGLIPCLVNKEAQNVLTESAVIKKERKITDETILVEL